MPLRPEHRSRREPLVRAALLAVAGTALAVGVSAAVAQATAESTPGVGYFEQDGLRVDVEATPLDVRPGRDEGVHPAENVRLRFRVREAGEAGKPIAGLDPLAWLLARKPGEPVPERQKCEAAIRSLLAGHLARAADINLNEYLLVTLDDNNSISIVDPQVESSQTKTVGMVSLTSRGKDFVLSPDRRTALVTLPTQARVAAADLFRRKARYLEVGGTPHRIVLQPDGRLAWVGDATGTSVTAIAVEGFTTAGVVAVGAGPHAFAFRDDGRYLFVASPASPTLYVIDTQTVAVAARVDVGPGSVGVAYSAHSGQAYVGRRDGTLVAVDGKRFTRTASLSIGARLDGVWVVPGGRFGLALDGEPGRLAIVDLARNQVTHETRVGPHADQVTFTDTFAYVRHADSGDYALLGLDTLAQPAPPLVSTVVMGQRPPSVDAASIAPLVAPLPEGGGALVLSPADRAIYHYMEGMNAPMGAYQTYPWTAHGVLISDRTIREVEKGLYQTEFQAPAAGAYTVPFLVPTSPQLWGCFNLEVKALPGMPTTADTLAMEPLFRGHVFAPGAPQPLRVRLTNPATGAPLDGLADVMLLVMRGPTWQWRGAARGLGDGRYEVTVTFPEAGQYMVMVSSPSRGVSFEQKPVALAQVGAAGAGDHTTTTEGP